jgi:hypothetical protein
LAAAEAVLLFLLRDDQGGALLIAEAATKADADRFGRNCVPGFCGDSIEIEPESQSEDFWGVRTVRIARAVLRHENGRTAVRTRKRRLPTFTTTHIWVRGPQLPDEVESAGLLTAEDHRDLTLDHIARTCEFVEYVEILKWA